MFILIITSSPKISIAIFKYTVIHCVPAYMNNFLPRLWNKAGDKINAKIGSWQSVCMNSVMTHCKVYIQRMAIAEAFLWTRIDRNVSKITFTV